MWRWDKLNTLAERIEETHRCAGALWSWHGRGQLMRCQVGRARSLQLRLITVRCVLFYKRVWLHPQWLPSPPFHFPFLAIQSCSITHLLREYPLWPLSIHLFTVASLLPAKASVHGIKKNICFIFSIDEEFYILRLSVLFETRVESISGWT